MENDIYYYNDQIYFNAIKSNPINTNLFLDTYNIDFDLDNKRKDFLYANTCKGSSLQYQFVWREDMIEQLNVSDKKKLEELKDYPGWNEPAIMGCFLLLNKQFIRNDIFKKRWFGSIK